MKNKTLYISTLLVLSVVCIFLGWYAHKVSQVSTKITNNEPDFSLSTPFLNTMLECPDDTNVSDRFVCISELTDTLIAETDILANKLILQTPIRLKEITSNKVGQASFEYGGEDFLKSLPELVGKAQTTRDQHIASVCNLAEMNIFGSSGMDLEREACRYYYTKQYFEILKNLDRS